LENTPPADVVWEKKSEAKKEKKAYEQVRKRKDHGKA
jgi:hypothetical protein